MSKSTFSERNASLLADCSASVVIFSVANERLSRTQSQAWLGYAEAMVFLGRSQRSRLAARPFTARVVEFAFLTFDSTRWTWPARHETAPLPEGRECFCHVGYVIRREWVSGSETRKYNRGHSACIAQLFPEGLPLLVQRWGECRNQPPNILLMRTTRTPCQLFF